MPSKKVRVGIVGVDGDVGGACGQSRQDRGVEGVAARRHPDADAVAAADAARGQPLHALLDVGDQLGVGELDVAVVESTGSLTYVTTRGDDGLTIVLTGRSDLRAGERVGLAIAPGHVHLFDRESELAL